MTTHKSKLTNAQRHTIWVSGITEKFEGKQLEKCINHPACSVVDVGYKSIEDEGLSNWSSLSLEETPVGDSYC